MTAPTNKRTQLPCRLAPEHIEQVQILAHRHGATISDVVRTLLENELERHPVSETERTAYRAWMEKKGSEPSTSALRLRRTRSRPPHRRAVDTAPKSSITPKKHAEQK